MPELRLQAEGRHWEVDQPLAGLETLTPVRGSLRALHHGNALALSAEVETIITLCCDRCLQHFNQPLRAEVEELVECREQGAERAIRWEPGDSFDTPEDLDDRLDADGMFDPEHWLFEQLSLRLPLVNRCGPDCPGPATWSSAPETGDPRWAALQQLRP